MLRKKSESALKGDGCRLSVIAPPVITVKAMIRTVYVHLHCGLSRPDFVYV